MDTEYTKKMHHFKTRSTLKCRNALAFDVNKLSIFCSAEHVFYSLGLYSLFSFIFLKK